MVHPVFRTMYEYCFHFDVGLWGKEWPRFAPSTSSLHQFLFLVHSIKVFSQMLKQPHIHQAPFCSSWRLKERGSEVVGARGPYVGVRFNHKTIHNAVWNSKVDLGLRSFFYISSSYYCSSCSISWYQCPAWAKRMAWRWISSSNVL